MRLLHFTLHSHFAMVQVRLCIIFSPYKTNLYPCHACWCKNSWLSTQISVGLIKYICTSNHCSITIMCPTYLIKSYKRAVLLCIIHCRLAWFPKLTKWVRVKRKNLVEIMRGAWWLGVSIRVWSFRILNWKDSNFMVISDCIMQIYENNSLCVHIMHK